MGNLDLANHDLKSSEDIETTLRSLFQITSYETLLKLDGKIWQISSDLPKLFSAKHSRYTVHLVHTLNGHANLNSSLLLIMQPFNDIAIAGI